jgi:hypothetical protein
LISSQIQNQRGLASSSYHSSVVKVLPVKQTKSPTFTVGGGQGSIQRFYDRL